MLCPVHKYLWLEYMRYKWPRICCTCRKHFPVLSSFMTYHRVCNYINKTGATSGAGTAYPSGAPEFTTGFSGVRATRSLDLCVCFVDRCLSFILWPLSCLSFTLSWFLITIMIRAAFTYTLFIQMLFTYDTTVPYTTPADRRGRMIVGFTATCAISYYHH
jgi:hypothetical protein